MSSITQKQYYDNNSIYQTAERLYSKEKHIRQRLLDYYSVCMPIEYELFNYMKTLIKKNKFNSIDIDVFDMNVGKYIRKQQYPNEVMEDYYEDHDYIYPPRDNIWFYRYEDLRAFQLERIYKAFPEFRFTMTNCICFKDITNDMIEPYLKSEEYKEDRRDMIIMKKEEVDILELEKKYKDNKDELNNILKNTIDLYNTFRQFLRKGHINETLHIYCEKKKYSFDDDKIIKKFEFKKTKKSLMCSWNLWVITNETNGQYKDSGKFRLDIDRYMKNEYETKLDKLFSCHIGNNSFTITTDHYHDDEQNILRMTDKFYNPDRDWVFNMGWKMMGLHLNKPCYMGE